MPFTFFRSPASGLSTIRLRRCRRQRIFAFSCSTNFAVNLAVGMTVFLPSRGVPAIHRALLRGAALRTGQTFETAALLALIDGGGGHYVLPLALMFAGVHTLLRLRELGFKRALGRLDETSCWQPAASPRHQARMMFELMFQGSRPHRRNARAARLCALAYACSHARDQGVDASAVFRATRVS